MSALGSGEKKGADDALAAGLTPKVLDGANLELFILELEQTHRLSAATLQLFSVETDSCEPCEWDDTPIPIKCTAPLKFDPNLLPAALADYAVDVSERLEVTIDLIVAPLLLAFGVLLGRRYMVRMKANDNWLVGGWNFGAIIASPSSRKSAAMEAGMLPLRHVERLAEEHNKVPQKKWAAQRQMLDANRKQLIEQINQVFKSGAKLGQSLENLQDRLEELEARIESETPKPLRISFADATPEKVVDLAASNPNGLLCVRDELRAFLMGMAKQGRESERGLYLEGWTGATDFRLDRVGRGSTVVKNFNLSLFGTIQPGPMGQLVKQAKGLGGGDDGFMQRFQFMVVSDKALEPRFVDRAPNKAAKQLIEETAAALFDLDHDRQDLRHEEFYFSESAQSVCREYCKAVLTRARESQSPALEAHLGKYPRLFGCVSNILHQTKWASKECQKTLEISQLTALAAVEICDFFESHAMFVYGAHEGTTDCPRAIRLLEEINNGRVRDRMPLREIYRNQWANLKHREDVEAAVKALEPLGWCVLQRVQQGRGASSQIIRLHPSLRG